MHPPKNNIVPPSFCRINPFPLFLYFPDIMPLPLPSPTLGCQPTWFSRSVCSKRGPVMASARGLWVRDQTSVRLGACWTVVGAGPPVTWGTFLSPLVGTVVDSNCRAVAVNDRFESWRGRPWATALIRKANILWRLWFVVFGSREAALGTCGPVGKRQLTLMELQV